MQSRDKKLSVIICLSDQQGCRYVEVNVVELDGNMLKHLNLKLFNFVGILQVIKLEFQTFRILEILNFHLGLCLFDIFHFDFSLFKIISTLCIFGIFHVHLWHFPWTKCPGRNVPG